MENEIIKYLSKYVTLTDETKAIILESAMVRSFAKGTVLLKEGAKVNESYLVIKGCIRSYYIIDGKEKTTAFYTEEHVVTTSTYGKDQPSEHYLECAENTIASVGSPNMETEMFKNYPKLESICRVLSEVFLSKNQETFDSYIISSPESRYLQLLAARPSLFQRVPQHQIASYLGITPESLSRLRKRLQKKQNSGH